MTTLRIMVLITSIALSASCSTTSGPVEIPEEDLPFPVAREPSPTDAPVAARTFDIFLVRRGRLHAAERETTENVPTVEAAMRALTGGPTASERARGLRTFLPPDVGLLGIAVANGTATADLSTEFQRPGTPDDVLLRVAQVTWTLTEIPGIEQVRLAIDGELVSVTTQDGSTVSRPVGRADYSSVAPPR